MDRVLASEAKGRGFQTSIRPPIKSISYLPTLPKAVDFKTNLSHSCHREKRNGNYSKEKSALAGADQAERLSTDHQELSTQ
jgi:hypothetical protein